MTSSESRNDFGSGHFYRRAFGHITVALSVHLLMAAAAGGRPFEASPADAREIGRHRLMQKTLEQIKRANRGVIELLESGAARSGRGVAALDTKGLIRFELRTTPD